MFITQIILFVLVGIVFVTSLISVIIASSPSSTHEKAVKKDLVLNVPTDYPTIQDALNYANTRTIPSDYSITIKIEDGEYTNTEQINFNHTDGNRIDIIGNPEDPTKCKFTITGNFLFVSESAVRKISGLYITSTEFVSKGVWTTKSSSAISVVNTSHCNITDCIIKNTYYGVRVTSASSVTCNNVHVSFGGDGCFFCFGTSKMDIVDCTASDASDISAGLGSGCISENSSFVWVVNTIMKDNVKNSVFSNSSSSMWVDGCPCSGSEYGLVTSRAGCMELRGNTTMVGTTKGGSLSFGGILTYPSAITITLDGTTPTNVSVV